MSEINTRGGEHEGPGLLGAVLLGLVALPAILVGIFLALLAVEMLPFLLIGLLFYWLIGREEG